MSLGMARLWPGDAREEGENGVPEPLSLPVYPRMVCSRYLPGTGAEQELGSVVHRQSLTSRWGPSALELGMETEAGEQQPSGMSPKAWWTFRSASYISAVVFRTEPEVQSTQVLALVKGRLPILGHSAQRECVLLGGGP